MQDGIISKWQWTPPNWPRSNSRAGLINRMITRRVHGIENYQEFFKALSGEPDNIKICCVL
jgi:hypothetical protein